MSIQIDKTVPYLFGREISATMIGQIVVVLGNKHSFMDITQQSRVYSIMAITADF